MTDADDNVDAETYLLGDTEPPDAALIERVRERFRSLGLDAR